MRNRFLRPFGGTCLVAATLASFSPSAFGQVLYERDPIAQHHGWWEGDPITEDLSHQKTYEHPAWRAKMLKQFPEADGNGDGKLTEAEAIQFHLGRMRVFTPQGRELEFLPEGVSRWTERVEMRDGETLPTEVYLPAGEGPWPVVLVRSTRGRIGSALDFGNELLRRGFAFVGQDLTPRGDFINADVLGREAEQRIYTGGRWASRVNLPVAASGASVDYDPGVAY